MAWPVAGSPPPTVHRRRLPLHRPATPHAGPGRRRFAVAWAQRYPQWPGTAGEPSGDGAGHEARLAAPAPSCHRWTRPAPAPPPAASPGFQPAGTATCPSLRRFQPDCQSAPPERRHRANTRSAPVARPRPRVVPGHAIAPAPCPDKRATQARRHRRHAAPASYPQPTAGPVPRHAHPVRRDAGGRTSGGRRWTPG